jgi:hypothetical protein
MSARPGELTECDGCESMLEYSGGPDVLKVMPARPERAKAYRDLERDKDDHASFQKMVAYVVKYRMKPRSIEIAHFRYSCRKSMT